MAAERKPQSLEDLRVRTAVKNLRRLPASVDGVDTPLLRRILPHFTPDQLTRIESLTKTDLTPVTDVLWKAFYRCQFGDESTNNVVRRMQQSGVSFNWKDLFKAKTEHQKKVEDKMVEALTEKWWARNAERQSNGIRLCTKVPPSSSCSKRSYSSSVSGSGGFKNPMLKKARMEVDNRARMQAAAIHKRSAQATNHVQPTRTTTASHRPNSTTTIRSAQPTSHGLPVRTTTGIHRPNSTTTIRSVQTASRDGQPMRTTTICRPNSSTTHTKPTVVNWTNQSSRSRFML